MASTRLTRAEQVERNRALVLAAARRVFLDRGYAGATLEAIAEEAGFSKGVVYSQFAGKADLFLTLLEQRIDDRGRELTTITAADADATAGELAAELNATFVRRSTEDADWVRVLLEFRLIAARDPELGARYAALHARTRENVAATLRAFAQRAGAPLPLPADELAEFLLAVDAGAALERTVRPDALSAPLLAVLFRRILDPAAPAGDGPRP